MEAPKPLRGDVLVRITAAAVCATDLHFMSGLLNLGIQPVTMGHEIVGRIEAVGDGVDAGRIGERVVVYYYDGCGICGHCRVGDEHLCGAPRRQFGFAADGGYAEFASVPSRNAVRLPESISDVDAAPIGCGVTTAVHALSIADAAVGQWAVVYGVGGVGLGLIQLCKHAGLRVAAVSRTPVKLEKARELGADAVIDGSRDSVAERIRTITGAGADVVFDCVGSAQSIDESLKSLAKRAKLVMIGYSEAALTVHPLQLIVGEQRVTGSVGATLSELHQAVDLVARGVVRTIVDKTYPLGDFAAAIDSVAKGTALGKPVLLPAT